MVRPIQHIKEVVCLVLALAIRIAEHKTEACFVDAVAILLQTNLGIIIEGFLGVVVETGSVAQRTIRWVEIEERVAVGMLERLLEIACHNFHSLQQFAILADGRRVANLRIGVFAERNIEKPFLVHTIQAVEARAIEEEELSGILYRVEVLLVVAVASGKEELLACLLRL